MVLVKYRTIIIFFFPKQKDVLKLYTLSTSSIFWYDENYIIIQIFCLILT